MNFSLNSFKDCQENNLRKELKGRKHNPLVLSVLSLS